MSEFICPKCNGTMRSYERNGVTIEQCTECRGVFLDRGELDRMIDAEGQRYEEPVRAAQPVQPQPQYQQPAPQYRDEYRDRGHDDYYYKKKKKRHGFLSELFDD